MKPVPVIGGGLAGLVAAEQLRRSGTAAVVLERQTEPGGCCRSISRDGFTFDYTGHLLHLARGETRDYLEQLGIMSQLSQHTRRAAVVVGGRATPYPIQINTHGLAPEVRRDCLLGFIRAWADPAQESGAGPPATFREWVLQRFGEGLARHFFFPYNSKLYRVVPEELSIDWVDRFVPRPTLEEVVDGALGLHHRPVGYNATFWYPASGGIRLLPDGVAARLGDELRLRSEVVLVHRGEHWLELAGGERLAHDRVIATGSLPGLIDMLAEPLPAEVVEARRRLRWVRVLNVALGVAGTAPCDEHWRYFPDPELPFYRVGFPSNHGRVAPGGHHTVSVEVSLSPGRGDADVEAHVRASEQALARQGLLDPARIVVRQVTMVDPAYVVFDHHHAEAVSTLRSYLEEGGIQLAGRWAEWKYSAMEDALLDGMAAARRVRAS